MTGLTETERESLADAVEVTLGLGVADVDGCDLCGRSVMCPVHVGLSAADALAPVVEQIVAARVTAALKEAADAIEARAGTIYSTAIFIEPTAEKYAAVNALLKSEFGHQLDGISADVMRRAHVAIAAEIREGTLGDYLTPLAPPT